MPIHLLVITYYRTADAAVETVNAAKRQANAAAVFITRLISKETYYERHHKLKIIKNFIYKYLATPKNLVKGILAKGYRISVANGILKRITTKSLKLIKR